MRDLRNKIAVTLQPIFVSKKLEQDLKPKEIKPSIVSQQCVVYKFACDIMLTKQPDSFNALPNTSIQLSVKLFKLPAVAYRCRFGGFLRAFFLDRTSMLWCSFFAGEPFVQGNTDGTAEDFNVFLRPVSERM